ncbi:MAG: hypothetical protein ACE15D_18385 [Candidatus Eisenbacteria bacterium]|nr:hypothetical protein [Candidatus Eisenbacteria bacterium]
MRPVDGRVLLLAFVGFLLSFGGLVGVRAADKSNGGGASAAMSEAPEPSAEIQRLASYAGVFEGSGTLSMEGKSFPIKIRHEWRSVADGAGMEVHETADCEATGHRDAANLFGMDESGKLHLFTVGNDAETHDHAGTWSDPTHFRLRYEGTFQGKPMIEEIPATLEGPDQYSFEAITTLDGKEFAKLAVTMRRAQTAGR